MSICFGTKTPEEKEGIKNSREIDEMLKQQGKYLKEEIKLLLLGPGESGKSTIFKQMKIIQKDGGFSEEERLEFKPVIVGNCITQMKVLLGAARKKGLEVSEQNKAAAERIVKLAAQSDAWEPASNLADIELLWKDQAIKEIYKYRDIDFQLNDSTEYFLDRIHKYIDDKYVPDEQDVLRARVRTTGIDEAHFAFDDMNFRMVDVGGQRTERRKWIHCFEGVTAVLFCTALSEYDQVLREDKTKNRMHESLELFQEICNSQWFAQTSIMLFLNKIDLFVQKIAQKDLTCCFPEYIGGCNYDKASAYINEQFNRANGNTQRKIYSHFTCAVDTNHIIVIFKAVRETLLESVFTETGLSM